MTTLSVLMPHFNHGAFVEEAVRAILYQSRSPDEFIVLDDGSTDGSIDQLRRLAADDPRVTLIEHERNRGPVSSVQELLEMASGDHVFFTAADDRVEPRFIERSLELLEAFPSAGTCSALSRMIDAEGRDLGLIRSPVVSSSPTYLDPARVQSIWRLHPTWQMANASVYRRNSLMEAGGFRSHLESFADGFICLALGLRHGACFIPEPLASFRLMRTGYWATNVSQPGKESDLWRRAAVVMRQEFPDVFDEGSVRLWEERLQMEAELRGRPRWQVTSEHIRFAARHHLPVHRALLMRLWRKRVLRRDARRRNGPQPGLVDWPWSAPGLVDTFDL